jgi:4,5-dihydroxyphthalate decarboxylase
MAGKAGTVDERSAAAPTEGADTRLHLKIVLGTYPHTVPLKEGRVQSDRLVLDFEEVKPANRAFRPMANQLIYDVSEMALVTVALAKRFERPLVGIPSVMMCQSAHAMLLCHKDSPLHDPRDLAGKTLGARSYSATTGTWTRAMLQHQYGVDLDSLRWVTFEPSHLDGFVDPANAQRAPEGKSLVDMLLSGELDAGVAMDPKSHPDLRPVLPNAKEAEREFAELIGTPYINHLVVVKQSIVDEFPWVPAELYRLFAAGRDAAAAEGTIVVPDPGLEQNRKAMEVLMALSYEQGLIPRAYAPEELFLPLN